MRLLDGEKATVDQFVVAEEVHNRSALLTGPRRWHTRLFRRLCQSPVKCRQRLSETPSQFQIGCVVKGEAVFVGQIDAISPGVFCALRVLLQRQRADPVESLPAGLWSDPFSPYRQKKDVADSTLNRGGTIPPPTATRSRTSSANGLLSSGMIQFIAIEQS